MAKRKKHPKLPNGYGSITYFGKGRRNPYGVFPPCTEEYSNGSMKRPKALCYVNDWYVGFAVLTAYKAGTYIPGMEKDLATLQNLSEITELPLLTEKILEDYSALNAPTIETSPTFSEVYADFYNWKFNGKKQLSKSSEYLVQAAYKKCEPLYDKPIDCITYEEMQVIIDSCPLKHSPLEAILSLLKQIYRYAVATCIVEKDPTALLAINIDDDDEHGVPFNDNDLKILWSNKDDEIVQILLIMIYSGFRIGELEVVDVNLEKKCFTGGLKTKTSKERIVPIHSSIYEIVSARIEKYKQIMLYQPQTYRKKMYTKLEELGIARHTPHDCRHTFSALCEKYKVNENDRKRMLGHKIKDITNDVYGHRTLEELRTEIEKIPCCELVANRTDFN